MQHEDRNQGQTVATYVHKWDETRRSSTAISSIGWSKLNCTRAQPERRSLSQTLPLLLKCSLRLFVPTLRMVADLDGKAESGDNLAASTYAVANITKGNSIASHRWMYSMAAGVGVAILTLVATIPQQMPPKHGSVLYRLTRIVAMTNARPVCTDGD